MDGRYEEPEDVSRRKFQRRHYVVPQLMREREHLVFKDDPHLLAYRPQTTYKTAFETSAASDAERAYTVHGRTRGRLGDGSEVLGPPDEAKGGAKLSLASFRPGGARALRPVLRQDYMLKTNALPPFPSSEEDCRRLQRVINEMNYVSSYQQSYDHEDRPWPAELASKLDAVGGGGERQLERGAPPKPKAANGMDRPDPHVTTYALNHDAPDAREVRKLAGECTPERYHKGQREGKGMEHGWSRTAVLPRMSALPVRLETSYHEHYNNTVVERGTNGLFCDTKLPQTRRRHNPAFPRMARELWGQ